MSVRSGHPRQQPARELPVSANPAVATIYVGAVTGRVFLVQLHVAQQAGARITTFQQVVAEDAVLGKAPLERLFKGRHIIDSLADERAFLEQVLIDIGDGAGIGIYTWHAAVKLGVA